MLLYLKIKMKYDIIISYIYLLHVQSFRIKEFDDAIQEDHLDILQIRKLCFAGKLNLDRAFIKKQLILTLSDQYFIDYLIHIFRV